MNPYFDLVKRNTSECREIKSVSKADYSTNKSDLLKIGHPFIIKNFLSLNECKGVIDNLLAEMGDKIITARAATNPLTYATNRAYFKMPLKEYYEKILNESDELLYAANNSLSFELLDKIKIGFPLSENYHQFETPKLWMGPKSSSTPLHRDSSDNFAYQLGGQKKWTIFSIVDTDYLYFTDYYKCKNTNLLSEFATSPIDLKNIDLKKYPLLSQAIKLEVIINPGEVLYLPYAWGHSVENLSISVMINFWFQLEDYLPLLLRERLFEHL